MEPEPSSSSRSLDIVLDVNTNSPEWSSVECDFQQFSLSILSEASSILFPDSRNQIEVSLLLTDDDNMEALNRKFLNKEGPTNVLSFPSLPYDKDEIFQNINKNSYLFLGDIALSYETIAAESIQFEKTFLSHFAHMLVHGFLHLLGYDHLFDKDALVMENLEKRILNKVSENKK